MIRLKEILDKSKLESDIKSLEKELERKYPQLEDLHIYLAANGTLFVGSIKVKLEDRHQGIGKMVMGEIMKFADDNGLIISLSPEPQHGYKKQLDRFYKDLGFVPNKGRTRDYALASFFGSTMYRRPRKTIS